MVDIAEHEWEKTWLLNVFHTSDPHKWSPARKTRRKQAEATKAPFEARVFLEAAATGSLTVMKRVWCMVGQYGGLQTYHSLLQDAQSSVWPSPLHAASCRGRLACVDWLMGINGAIPLPHARDVPTPLMLACANGHEEVACKLLTNSSTSDALAFDGNGNSAVCSSILRGHLKLALLLLGGVRSHHINRFILYKVRQFVQLTTPRSQPYQVAQDETPLTVTRRIHDCLTVLAFFSGSPICKEALLKANVIEELDRATLRFNLCECNTSALLCCVACLVYQHEYDRDLSAIHYPACQNALNHFWLEKCANVFHRWLSINLHIAFFAVTAMLAMATHRLLENGVKSLNASAIKPIINYLRSHEGATLYTRFLDDNRLLRGPQKAKAKVLWGLFAAFFEIRPNAPSHGRRYPHVDLSNRCKYCDIRNLREPMMFHVLMEKDTFGHVDCFPNANVRKAWFKSKSSTEAECEDDEEDGNEDLENDGREADLKTKTKSEARISITPGSQPGKLSHEASRMLSSLLETEDIASVANECSAGTLTFMENFAREHIEHFPSLI